MSDTNPVPCKHVVSTDFDSGEAILVDLNTKKYFQLNETAKLVWRALEQGKRVDEIVNLLTTEYDVTADHAAQSVRKLVDDFESYKLVDSK